MLAATAFGLSAVLVLCGCFSGGLSADVGKPTDEEIAQMNAWAAVVTPLDREQVTRAAALHTDWSQRRKVQYTTGEYKRRYLHEQAHPTATRPTTARAKHHEHQTTQPTTETVEPIGPGGL
jgi:hypothetical protein